MARRYRFRRRPRRTRRWGLRLLTVLVMGGAVAWTVGLALYAEAIPRVAVPLMVDAPADERVDAIVVLTGGSRRLEAGAMLLRDAYAPVLFVSGVHPRVGRAGIRSLISSEDTGLDDAQVTCCVVLGYGATDTIGNARETADWMALGGRRSLILVTSNYHMPRARLEFEHALPESEIREYPVIPEDVRLDAWWRYPGTFGLLAGEWTKHLFARLRIGLYDIVAGRS